MSYTIAGIDVHKRVLVVVVSDITAEEWKFEGKRFGTTTADLARLREWLLERQVQEAVMESTAQYWKPVWLELEEVQLRLHLAQAQSNRARRGRKNDYADARRLVRRLVAGELILSFVPQPEQRGWRTMTRMKVQLRRDRVRLQNQVECLLEEMRIKLSSVISDLLGISGRRILRALAAGCSNAAQLAALGHPRLSASRERLEAALRGQPSQVQQHLLGLYLDHIELIDRQLEQLDGKIAAALAKQQDAVVRLAEVPGLGADSAQQVIAEVGPQAETFPTAGELASWVGVCPGENESAGENHSGRSPKGNCYLRRILNQAAQAAVKTKGSVFEALFRRLLPRLGFNKAIWAVAHRLCRLIWKILHQGVRYIEYGESVNPKALKHRVQRMVRKLRSLGYRVESPEAIAPELDFGGCELVDHFVRPELHVVDTPAAREGHHVAVRHVVGEVRHHTACTTTACSAQSVSGSARWSRPRRQYPISDWNGARRKYLKEGGQGRN